MFKSEYKIVDSQIGWLNLTNNSYDMLGFLSPALEKKYFLYQEVFFF